MRAALVLVALSSVASAAPPKISVVYSHGAYLESGGTTAPSTPVAHYGIQRTKRGTAVWRASSCIAITYDSATVDAATERVLNAAFAAWMTGTKQCGGIEVTTTRDDVAARGIDGLSTVHVHRDEWPYNPDAAAVTRLAFIDDPSSPDDGKIVEADMELNAYDFELVMPGARPITQKAPLYLQAVATHEAGHVLGLAHACGTGDEDWPTDYANQAVPACDAPEVQAATMFVAVGPLDDGPSTLEPSDIEGACAIFRELACVAEVEGGCNAANRRAGLWIVLAFAFAARRCRGA